MKDIKRRLEYYSFFNYTGICRHLEKMCAQGWMLERTTPFWWVYRRIEPRQVHFSISYYEKASEFDPAPSESQQMFYDFCEHSGWRFVCSVAQMQIFCNEQEHPVPIETDPVMEMESIHASSKKSFLLPYFLLLFVSLFNLAIHFSSWMGDPVGHLASSASLFTVLCFAVLFLICCVELASYFLWLHRARESAPLGSLPPVPNTMPFQKVMLVIVLLGALYFACSLLLSKDSMQQWLMIALPLVMFGVIFATFSLRNFMRKKKVSRRINTIVTYLTAILGTILVINLVLILTLYASSHGFFAEKDAETYEYQGQTWTVGHDHLPLSLEDLMDAQENIYSKSQTGSESIFLARFEMQQFPRFDLAEEFKNAPTLEYRLTRIKIPALYEFCKEKILDRHETVLHLGMVDLRDEDPAPWGALEAYRLINSEYGPTDEYILCYEGQIVEIQFDWDVTEAQKTITGEKLAPSA